eukprot:gene6669-9442_t
MEQLCLLTIKYNKLFPDKRQHPFVFRLLNVETTFNQTPTDTVPTNIVPTWYKATINSTCSPCQLTRRYEASQYRYALRGSIEHPTHGDEEI